MGSTPIYQLRELADVQATADLKVNENTCIMEALIAGKVISRTLTAPPGSESNGDMYIVGASATGGWSGEDGNFAIFVNGAYIFKTPYGGQTVFIHAEKAPFMYSSQESAWFPLIELWSSTEHWTGGYSLLDGKKIYSKVVDCGTLPNSTLKQIAHGITNVHVENHFKAMGFAYYSSGSTMFMPGTYILFALDSGGTYLNLSTSTGLSIYTNSRVRIEYCKTA